MPLILSSADALPYVDPAPSKEALQAADALIRAELDDTTSEHPSLPQVQAVASTPAIQTAYDSIASGQKAQGGIDLSRYDVIDAPAKGDLPGWNAALSQAHASAEYLRGRELNLGLLETYGKNAWLIGNSQLEDVLRDLERDVETAKAELQSIEEERRTLQGNAAGEMQSLQDTWRQGVGRMIEAQVAGERLRQEVLERRRQGVS